MLRMKMKPRRHKKTEKQELYRADSHPGTPRGVYRADTSAPVRMAADLCFRA